MVNVKVLKIKTNLDQIQSPFKCLDATADMRSGLRFQGTNYESLALYIRSN